MSKKKATRNRPLAELTRNLDKKGRLKGKNKKETKMLKGMCLHHKYNKHGDRKPAIVPGGKKFYYCKMCGSTIRLNTYTKEHLTEVVEEMTNINNQAKYLATAVNAGNAAVEYFASCGIALTNYKKYYIRVATIARKQSKIKKRKKRSEGSSAQYGAWRAKGR